jgi:hypothetical protein
VTNKRGESAVLLTTRTYSSTTSGHVSCVAGACRHLTVFHVHNPTDLHRADQFSEYRARQVALMRDYAKARTRKPHIFKMVGECVAEANEFAKFFGLRTRLAMPKDGDAMTAECAAIDAKEKARVKRAQSKAKRAAAERDRKRLADLEKWVHGDPCDFHDFYGLPTRLRIADGELQTSLRAQVPIAKAKQVYRILARLRKKGQTYKRNGETISVGPFALDSMDENGTVEVGCHTIEWAEIERVAKLAGL